MKKLLLGMVLVLAMGLTASAALPKTEKKDPGVTTFKVNDAGVMLTVTNIDGKLNITLGTSGTQLKTTPVWVWIDLGCGLTAIISTTDTQWNALTNAEQQNIAFFLAYMYCNT